MSLGANPKHAFNVCSSMVATTLLVWVDASTSQLPIATTGAAVTTKQGEDKATMSQ